MKKILLVATVTQPLHLDLGPQFQSFPICSLRWHELGLPNFSRERKASVQTTGLEHLSVQTLDRLPSRRLVRQRCRDWRIR
jgi:hypothetical protein